MGSPIGADLGCCRRNDQPGPLSPGSAASTDRLNAATRAGAEAIVGLMRDKLLAAMRDRGGFITRSDALLLVDRHIVDKALRFGATSSMSSTPRRGGSSWTAPISRRWWVSSSTERPGTAPPLNENATSAEMPH
jgi:hypothetical protein